MKKGLLLSFLAFTAFGDVHAQSKEGMKQIEKLCGCFSVNFRYAETFSPDIKYKYHDREDMNAMELVLPIEKSDKKIVMQHLLVINDSMIIKHWREEWAYENPEIYEYTAYRVWEKKTLPAAQVKNKWTQTVWEVSDEPRYQGISSWIENDGKMFWESTADAPLPRREYTVRNDYNIMKRRNRITITNDGYMHEQDNDKIQRENKEDKLIAQEKGYNTYHKMEEKDCKTAAAWWKKNEQFWTVVRDEWKTVMDKSNTISLKWTVDEKQMNEHFNELWKEWRNNKINANDIHARVREVMTKFM